MDFPARERIAGRGQRGRLAVFAAVAAAIVTLTVTMTATAGTAAAAGCVNSWGNGEVGQLGKGISLNDHLPGPVKGIREPILCEVSAISAGGDFSLALLNNTEKTVASWGQNNAGQLGNGKSGEKEQSSVPLEVGGPEPSEKLTKVVAVSAGQEFGLALTENGTEKKVMAWGDDEWGQLGNGVKGLRAKSAVPVEVKFPIEKGPLTVKEVEAGATHALALVENTEKRTSVWAWGLNEFGELGIGNNTGPEKCLVSEIEGKREEFGCSSKPVEVKGLTGATITAVSAGYQFSLALTSAGAVKAWGDHEFGQLGNGETRPECKSLECPKEFKTEPVAVHGEGGTGELTGVGKIAAGGFHALALMNNTEKTVKAWGANEMGQLGSGETKANNPNPVAVKEASPGTGPLTGVSAIAGGFTHSLALLSNGKVDAWGDNQSGELGNGTTTNSNVPVPVGQGLGEVTAVSAGKEFSLSLGAGAPIVTEVHPKTGPEAGGTRVIIDGINFSGATAVKFGSVNALGFTERSPTSIEATSPPETEKVCPVEVTVTTPAMISRTSEKDLFYCRPAGLNATDWVINGVPASTTPRAYANWGTLTFENTFAHSLIGKVACHTVLGGTLWNEGEAGFTKNEAFDTFGCVKEPAECPGTFLTAEEEIKSTETLVGTEKIVTGGHRGESFLPWTPGEMYETENTEKQRFFKVKMPNVLITLVDPCQTSGKEVRFRGTLEPLVVNGLGNGLTPTHLKFQGRGGQTGVLEDLNAPSFQKSEREVPVSGELTMVGSMQQLIIAR
jgi:alpha-tubulin suppressor-like RCC1 family protein